MVRMLIAGMLMIALAAPAHAAGKAHAVRKVYLRDGGIIEARSVWRSQGRVHVLVNRDTLAEFHPAELDMKRTFSRPATATSRKSKAARKRRTAGAVIAPETVQQTPKKKSGMSLPNLPSFPVKLPEKTPSSLGGKDEGAIRKHKKEMSERINE